MSEGKRVVRHYPIEFKVDAVKLLEEQDYAVSEAANRLGIPQATSPSGVSRTVRGAHNPATSGHNRPPGRPSCGACKAR